MHHHPCSGIGYEEATPCSMCQSGLCRTGVVMAHYSSHTGVKSVPVSHRPHLVCQSLDMAKRRTYPKSTVDPDAAAAAGAAAGAAVETALQSIEASAATAGGGGAAAMAQPAPAGAAVGDHSQR